MGSRFDIAGEKLRIRQETREARRDMRNDSVPYFDVRAFDVQHYADLTNGLVKLLKNSAYLVDEIYYRIPTTFRFYTRTQRCRTDGGSEVPAGEWELQETRTLPKNTLLASRPYPMEYQGHEFSAWAVDPDLSSAIDFGAAVGPVSAYAAYSVKDYRLRFLDYYGHEVTDISTIAAIKDSLTVSAFSDVSDKFRTAAKSIAQKVDEWNKADRQGYSDLTNYYLYGFDQGYPDSLSNVRSDMSFRGVYTYVKEPAYSVRNYKGAYDGNQHGISVEFADGQGRYRIEYSTISDGSFDESNYQTDYTGGQTVSVFFKISAYSEALGEYKGCGKTDFGTVCIYKEHLLQEENWKSVKTESGLSVLI